MCGDFWKVGSNIFRIFSCIQLFKYLPGLRSRLSLHRWRAGEPDIADMAKWTAANRNPRTWFSDKFNFFTLDLPGGLQQPGCQIPPTLLTRQPLPTACGRSGDCFAGPRVRVGGFGSGSVFPRFPARGPHPGDVLRPVGWVRVRVSRPPPLPGRPSRTAYPGLPDLIQRAYPEDHRPLPDSRVTTVEHRIVFRVGTAFNTTACPFPGSPPRFPTVTPG